MCVLLVFTNMSEILLTLIIIQRDIIVKVQRASCKIHIFLVTF